ncbi:lytic transglycosylase domain-containing protein [Formivibrio citricus]|nr:lytic transglycosylase domain-containing protein [Formivibrio citricus]
MKKLLSTLLFALVLPVHAKVDLPAVLEAARSHNTPQLARLMEKSQGDLLEMYPRYYWLSDRIRTLSAVEVADFFTRYPDTPLAERFRAEWLKELGRRQDWPAYVAEYPKLEKPATELQCYQAQAGLALGQRPVLLQAKPLWLTGQGLPLACAPVFDALFAQGLLNTEDAWKRIRLALFDDNTELAAQIAARVGSPAALSAKNLAGLRQQPARGGQQAAESRAGREAALYALSRLARNDPEQAAKLLSGMESHWPEADRRYGWRVIGVLAAKRHHPQANAWLAHAGAGGMNAESRAWAIRAGLRAGDWRGVLARIDALPDTERKETVWRYWRARALRELGRTVEANQLFSNITNGDEFYSLLAREELGTVLSTPAVQYRASEDEIRAMMAQPGVKRAFALLQQNWRTEAIREWNWAMRGLSDQMLIAAAEGARRERWHDRAIYAADRTKQLHNYELRYLTPYRDIVEKRARAEGLDPAWVYGLMRQESRFISDAKSGVGARGLMQLMPATARWVAKKLGWKKFDLNNVNEISNNVALGSHYLGEVWKKLGSSQVLASAGYNAGPGRARAWQADRPLEAAVYIENIPFTETRDYVKKVMANAMHYAPDFGSNSTSLKARIGTIPAKGGSVNNLP